MQVIMKFKCNRLELPVHYNHVIQGFIYKNISNKDFREFLHEEGFKDNKRRFKLFTFSRLMGNYVFNSDKKTITFIDTFNLVVCSIVDDFINDFVKTCLFEENLYLNKQLISVTGVETYRESDFGQSVKVTTLSPIVTYSTVSIEGKRKTIYHSPEEKYFKNILRRI